MLRCFYWALCPATSRIRPYCTYSSIVSWLRWGLVVVNRPRTAVQIRTLKKTVRGPHYIWRQEDDRVLQGCYWGMARMRNHPDVHEWTRLHVAFQEVHDDIVRLLLPVNHGLTPLHVILRQGHGNLLRYYSIINNS